MFMGGQKDLSSIQVFLFEINNKNTNEVAEMNNFNFLEQVLKSN